MKQDLEEEALELRRKYHRDWRRRNRARVAEYNKTYWLRRAEAEKRRKEAKNNDTTKNDDGR